jgi:ABC-2 type transport system ATP-binding protein
VNVIETAGLGKRFRRIWALRDCTLAVPAGRIAALVGPNGAGKTTLLHTLVGLTSPTTGRAAVLGGVPAGSLQALERVAFVAQDAPLYPNLPVRDMVHLARNLNPHWDGDQVWQRLEALRIPLGHKVGKLSGGQQAQLALTLAVARRPRLLVLDEPMARLDPLARHEFLALLMGTVAQDELSILLSSHVVSELERVADYLIVLSQGRVQVSGEVEDLLGSHRILTGPTRDAEDVARRLRVVHSKRALTQSNLLVRIGTGEEEQTPSGWESHPVALEDLILSYLREPEACALPGPAAPSTTEVTA